MLRLHSAPSFAAQWLSPRLSRFLRAHPGSEVRLAAGTDYARFTSDEFDADIVCGPPRQDGLVIVPLGEETVTLLCSPELGRQIDIPMDLDRCVLIESDNSRSVGPRGSRATACRRPVPTAAASTAASLA